MSRCEDVESARCKAGRKKNRADTIFFVISCVSAAKE